MLSYATEALPGGSLLCDLSCLAGCYACGVAVAMGGRGGNGAGGVHARRSTRLPSLPTSSTRRAQPAWGGVPARAGRKADTTCCTCVVPGLRAVWAGRV